MKITKTFGHKSQKKAIRLWCQDTDYFMQNCNVKSFVSHYKVMTVPEPASVLGST